VRATGTVAVDGDRYQLCLRQSMSLELTRRDEDAPQCDDQVSLRDAGDLLTGTDGTRRQVTGMWDAGWIDVRQVDKAPPEQFDDDITDPPCPAPDGGWAYLKEYDPRTPNADSRPLDRYQHDNPRVLTAVAYFRPTELQPVLTVASTDPGATRAALAPSYPDALCVVRSRYSWEETEDAWRQLRRAFVDAQLPGLYETGKSIGADGQTTIFALVRNDRPEVEEAVAGIPPDLLDLNFLIEVIDPA
jgi:hypothetical protein